MDEVNVGNVVIYVIASLAAVAGLAVSIKYIKYC